MPVCCLLLTALWASTVPAVYNADIILPVELYTVDGTAIPKGKAHVEIRRDGAETALAFLREGKAEAIIQGKPDGGNGHFTVPLIGALLLWPAQPAKSGMRSDTSPYLTNISWKATLRFYRAANPANTEVRAIFRETTTRVVFSLYLARPDPKAKEP